MRHRAVVVLLVALVVDRLGVLRSMRRVHARRLGGGGSVGVRVHVLSSDSVRHVCGNRHAAELASGGWHHGVLVLGREWLVGDVHALEAMSKSRHVGWTVVHAVCPPDLATSAVLVAIAHVGVAVAHVGPRVAVLALVVVVVHRRHLWRGGERVKTIGECLCRKQVMHVSWEMEDAHVTAMACKIVRGGREGSLPLMLAVGMR